jgi:hypothetical protein
MRGRFGTAIIKLTSIAARYVRRSELPRRVRLVDGDEIVQSEWSSSNADRKHDFRGDDVPVGDNVRPRSGMGSSASATAGTRCNTSLSNLGMEVTPSECDGEPGRTSSERTQLTPRQPQGNAFGNELQIRLVGNSCLAALCLASIRRLPEGAGGSSRSWRCVSALLGKLAGSQLNYGALAAGRLVNGRCPEDGDLKATVWTWPFQARCFLRCYYR